MSQLAVQTSVGTTSLPRDARQRQRTVSCQAYPRTSSVSNGVASHVRSRSPLGAPRLASFHVSQQVSQGQQHSSRQGRVRCDALISYVEVTADGGAPDDLAVEVHPTEAAVGARVCELLVSAAQAAVAERGAFFLAIPGGSVLKMCAGLVGKPMPWDKTFLFYVNHKCVSTGDKSSTHQKALDLFLTRVGAPLENVAALQGSADAVAEARAYEAKLRQVASERGMSLTPDAVPRFDLMLLGMGGDGHVGSLYPGRAEPAVTGPGAPLVLPVDKKQPPSITLSLPVMCAARQVVVAATGASKAEAVRGALQTPAAGGGGGSKTELPVRLVRPLEGGSAVWVMDGPAAGQLTVAVGAREMLAADAAARAL